MTDIREPKLGRPHAKARLRVRGAPGTRRKSEISIFIDDDLLAQCNEAWLRTNHRFFSRWVCAVLKEAISK